MEKIQKGAVKTLIEFYEAYLRGASSEQLAQMAIKIVNLYEGATPLLDPEVGGEVHAVDRFIYKIENYKKPTKKQVKEILHLLKKKLPKKPSKK